MTNNQSDVPASDLRKTTSQRQDAQGECLNFRDGVGLVGAVAEYARELGNLGDPPAIVLAFELNLERHEVIGVYVPDEATTFRIERAGSQVTLSMPAAEGASLTFELESVPAVVDRDRAYLFFGNSAVGTIFSNVRVRPRG